ncbi:unnamed protein product [Ectocarpus fasciculatus]
MVRRINARLLCPPGDREGQGNNARYALYVLLRTPDARSSTPPVLQAHPRRSASGRRGVQLGGTGEGGGGFVRPEGAEADRHGALQSRRRLPQGERPRAHPGYRPLQASPPLGAAPGAVGSDAVGGPRDGQAERLHGGREGA